MSIMKIRGKDVAIKSVYARQFPELRDLYLKYLSEQYEGTPESIEEAALALLRFALRRSDRTLSEDPNLLGDPNNPDDPEALDLDDIEQVVFLAAGPFSDGLVNLKRGVNRIVQVRFDSVGQDSLSVLLPDSEQPLPM